MAREAGAAFRRHVDTITGGYFACWRGGLAPCSASEMLNGGNLQRWTKLGREPRPS